MGEEINIAKYFNQIAKLPGYKVKRRAFLFEVLTDNNYSKHDIERVLDGKVVETLDSTEVRKIANTRINYRKNIVTGISAALGLPGGATGAAFVPADIIQFFYHASVLSQELAYLYGYPDIWDAPSENLEGNDAVLIFIGTMLGVGSASQLLKEVTSRLAVHAPQKVMKKAITKTLVYKVVKEVLSYIGVKVTKEKFAKFIGKVIPVVGSIVSGGLTYYSFGANADKLHNHFIETVCFKEYLIEGVTIDIKSERL